MTRNEIVAALVKDGVVEWKAHDISGVIERAGLCIIPKEPDDDEIERVAREIAEQEARDFFNYTGAAIPTNPQWWIDHVDTSDEHRSAARAAAAAVRMDADDILIQIGE